MQKDLDRQVGRFDNLIKNAPAQERALANITRQREIKSGLYLLLLEKREQNSINIAAQADNAKVVDTAMSTRNPVSPRKKMIMLIALFFALAIPSAILYIKYLLHYQIDHRGDIDKLTTLPILGDIPLEEDFKDSREVSVAVKEGTNNTVAEAFRQTTY